MKIAESVKGQVDEFRPKVPLLLALRKKGLKERHWKQLSSKIGIEVMPNEEFTFSQALNMNLLKHVDVCVETSEQAIKEWNIENNLN